jgi:hypothetical protein
VDEGLRHLPATALATSLPLREWAPCTRANVLGLRLRLVGADARLQRLLQASEPPSSSSRG